MFRIKRDGRHANFTCISNVPVRDSRLSPEQLGFLLKILSLPDDWNFSVSGTARLCGITVRKVRTLLSQLEKLGYLRREQEKDEQGRYSENCHYFFEQPLTENPHTDEPHTDEPHTDEPHTENAPQLNTNTSNTKEKENTILTKGAEESEIEERICADALRNEYNSSTITEAVEVIRSAMSAKQRTYSGVTADERELKRVFGAATQQDVRAALDAAGSNNCSRFAPYFGAVLFRLVRQRLDHGKDGGSYICPSTYKVDEVMQDIMAKYR